MSLEGELKLALNLRGGRVAAVHVTSTRPDIASRLLEGRRSDEVQAAVPRLFSVCAGSQAAACRMACAAAAGTATDSTALALSRHAVAEEMVRETAWQLLLRQPRWMSEVPAPEAIAAARAAQAWRCSEPADDDAGSPAARIAHAVFGCGAAAWLERKSWPEIAAWAGAGESAAARYLHRLAQAGADVDAVKTVALLPPPAPAWLSTLATAAAADPAITRAPLWQGGPAETGALARQQGHPLLQVAPLSASRPLARHWARLHELAHLLTGRWQPALGRCTLAAGSGLAWVENARGLLVHHVQLDGERVRLYRIVAPTEWNFHPQGALAAGLADAPAADHAAARQIALRLVDSLDPCVSCTVEVADA